MSSNEFTVSVLNTVGDPDGEWLCRQDRFCSYAPASLVTADSIFPLSQVSDYSSFAELLQGLNGAHTRVLIEDGSAKYGEPVCPESNCEAIVFFHNYMQNRRATCPIGTEMELILSGLTGDFERCVTPPADVILSGELPSECVLSAGRYCCAAGSSTTLHFVHQTAPCRPGDGEPCPYPLTGYAFGLCGVTSGACVRNLLALEVQQTASTPAPVASPTVAATTAAPVASPTVAATTAAPVASPTVAATTVALTTPPTSPAPTVPPSADPSSAAYTGSFSLFFFVAVAFVKMVF